MAVNCCVSPLEIVALPGAMAIERSAAGFTVSAALPEMAPEEAVMLAEPTATAAANPPLTVATPVFEDAHAAVEVRFCVELSE